MRARYKLILSIIIILLIAVIIFGLLKFFIFNEEEEKKVINTSSIISSIETYNYTLDDRDTKYMKELFAELEEVLQSTNVDEEKYATLLSQLFVADFYTLNNKINKYDVGSLEYVYNDKKEEFKEKAMDTIYKDIIDNTYKNRIQDLPEITKVNVLNIEKAIITLNEEEEEAIKVTMQYEYKEDLGYDIEGTIYLIKNLNKLEVVLYTPSITEE